MKTLLKAASLLVLLAAFAALAIVTFRVGDAPAVSLRPSTKALGARGGVVVGVVSRGRGFGGLRVEVEQQERTVVVDQVDGHPLPPWRFCGGCQETLERRVEVGRNAVPHLREGEVTVRVVAERASTWLRHPKPIAAEVRLPVLLRPPVLSVVSTQHYVQQGGAGIVVYRVSDTSIRDGVRAGSWFFPGSPLPDAATGVRFVLFGVPWDLFEASEIHLMASDAAGNTSERPFIDAFLPKVPTEDTIELSADFMKRVVTQIAAQTPGLADRGDLVMNYLQVNRDLRAKNVATLVELSKRSAPRFLWRGPFLSLRNAQVMSPFADRRTYLFAGREIDRQTHLGFDLASTARSEVPAANAGVVLLARYFGIYGNTVVLDHGFGLMTLYSHLSSIDVEEGREVARGAVIGRTGTTGLAGGDHLHFATLVGGLAVNPIEWWDDRWIRNRITSKLSPPSVSEATTPNRARK